MSAPDNPLLFTPEYLKTIETQEEADRIGGVIGGTYMVSGNTNWTLRDLFAAFALAGFCAVDETWPNRTPIQKIHAKTAEASYSLADAMLAEREPDE